MVNAGGGSINVALASNGGVASASSSYSASFPVSAIIDNIRTGANWGVSGGWNDNTANAWPDWVQINFNGSKTIDHVVVYTVQDNYANPVEPTDTMTFSLYGITAFTVQGWNGSAWVNLGSVSGNNLVKRTVNFSAFTTDRIRINVTAGARQLLPHHRSRSLGALTARHRPRVAPAPARLAHKQDRLKAAHAVRLCYYRASSHRCQPVRRSPRGLADRGSDANQ